MIAFITTFIIILSLFVWKFIDILHKLEIILDSIDDMQKKIQNIDSFTINNMELFCERLYNLKKETDDKFQELTIGYENIFKQISSHIPIRY